MTMNLKPLLLTAAMVAAGLTVSTVHAATTPPVQMPVTITIENACEIQTAPTTLDFGTHGVLTTVVDSTSIISVTCTTNAPFNIGLDGGDAGDIDARTMTNGTEVVAYQLYQEAARTTVWGNTVPTNTLTRAGTGVEEQYTVYGRVPVQTTPPAGTYNDSVTVVVTY